MQKMIEQLQKQFKDNPEAQKLLEKSNPGSSSSGDSGSSNSGGGWIKLNGKDLSKTDEKKPEAEAEQPKNSKTSDGDELTNGEKYQIIKEQRARRIAEEEQRKEKMQQKRAIKKDQKYLNERELFLKKLRQKLK